MKLSSFLTITNPLTRQDPFLQCIEQALQFVDELVIVDGGTTDGSLDLIPKDSRIKVVTRLWNYNFHWLDIGYSFNFGYEQCSGDWVIRLDSDYLLHEKDAGKLRQELINAGNAPVACLLKWQFVRCDQYNLKARVPMAFNKGLYYSNIKLNGGGDRCQPTFNGHEIDLKSMPDTGVEFYNYDFILKEQEVVRTDFARFARAWGRWKNNYQWGHDEDSAFKFFMEMQLGRFNRAQRAIKLEEHPRAMIPSIKNLKAQQFGHSLWGKTEPARYFKQ